jgi:hypothetical protein
MEITEALLTKLIKEQNFSYSQVAKITNKNVGNISRIAKKFGIISGHMGEIQEKSLPIETIYNKYISGVSLDALHKEYNMPVARVKRQLKKYKLDIVFRTLDEVRRPSELNDPIKLQEYVLNNKTCRQIAKELGVKESTVLSAYVRLNVSRFSRQIHEFIISKENLNDLYWNKKLSTVQISKIFGIHHGAVSSKLHEYNIPIRVFGKGNTKESKHKELNDFEWLYNKYIIEDKSMADIAREIKTSIGNISHHLVKYEIPIKEKEKVLEKLTSHGRKTIINSDYGVFECDSILETAFLENVGSLFDIKSIKKSKQISYGGVHAFIDFVINDDIYVEVKSKSESEIEGPDRSRLIKQFMVAKHNNINLKVWNGDLYNVNITDNDKYHAANYKLFFNNYDGCFNFLISYGFNDIKWSRHVLLKGIDRYNEIIKNPDNDFNTNVQGENVLDIIKHFSPHYYKSMHDKYNSVDMAWKDGNKTVLYEALKKLWMNDSAVNIYSLVKIISKYFKDFATVSIFKPWIAKAIYDLYLPNGGIVVDPCMGWGGRLMGCMNKNIKYIGYDINKNAIDSHENLKKFLGRNIGECSFTQADSSICDFASGDLLLTSPPYDNTELYYGVDSYKTETKPIYENIFKKFNGIIALNVPKRHEDLCKSIAGEYKYKLVNVHEMKTTSFMGREKTYEPIMVFKK